MLGMDEAGSAAEMRVLETDLDDATPETLGTLPDRLRQAGARHVSILPMTTKESRPGHLVRAVVRVEDETAVARALARETGSLGVRSMSATHAFVAETDRRVVALSIGEDTYDVGVKLAWMDAEVYDVSAEDAEAASVAAVTDLSPREVKERVEAAIGPLDAGYVVHLLERTRWEGREADTDYRRDEGIIPCTSPGRAAEVARSVFDSERDLLVLVIDPRDLSTPVRYEPSESGYTPQIDESVQPEAITAVYDVPKGPDGFLQPSELSTHSSSSSR